MATRPWSRWRNVARAAGVGWSDPLPAPPGRAGSIASGPAGPCTNAEVHPNQLLVGELLLGPGVPPADRLGGLRPGDGRSRSQRRPVPPATAPRGQRLSPAPAPTGCGRRTSAAAHSTRRCRTPSSWPRRSGRPLAPQFYHCLNARPASAVAEEIGCCLCLAGEARHRALSSARLRAAEARGGAGRRPSSAGAPPATPPRTETRKRPSRGGLRGQ